MDEVTKAVLGVLLDQQDAVIATLSNQEKKADLTRTSGLLRAVVNSQEPSDTTLRLAELRGMLSRVEQRVFGLPG